MTALPTIFPRVPLKAMDPAMLVFELDRESAKLNTDASTAELITSAATVASFLHRNQPRVVRAGMHRAPYIEHPLRVAVRLLRWGVEDAALVAAALLHDVLEDCGDELLKAFGSPRFAHFETPESCLARLYGKQVTGFVREVTNPEQGSGVTYHEHIAQLATSGSLALLIKASDLKDNAGSIKHQLGHGKDARLVQMMRKYLPTVDLVSGGLRTLDLHSHGLAAVTAAAGEMGTLQIELQELLAAHG